TGIVARAVRATGLSPIDRTLGFIFGLARGALLVCLAYLALDFVPPPDRPEWIREAKSAHFLQQGADELRRFFPEALRVKSVEAIDSATKALSPAIEADRAMRALTNPAAAPKPESAPTPSYRPGDQRASRSGARQRQFQLEGGHRAAAGGDGNRPCPLCDNGRGGGAQYPAAVCRFRVWRAGDLPQRQP